MPGDDRGDVVGECRLRWSGGGSAQQHESGERRDSHDDANPTSVAQGRATKARPCLLPTYQFSVTLIRASRPCRMLEGARYAVGVPPAPSAGTPATAVGVNVVDRTLK